jgi:hypothetical protein
MYLLPQIFFAHNSGDGVYAPDMTTANLGVFPATITVKKVGDAAVTSGNDGANCLNAFPVFPTCGQCHQHPICMMSLLPRCFNVICLRSPGNKNGASLAPNPNPVTDAECQAPYKYRPSGVKAMCSNNPCDVSSVGSDDHNVCCITETDAPFITTFNPVQGATGVAKATNIVLTFNEDVKKGDGNIVLTPQSGNPVSINAKSNQVTVAGKVVTIDPTSDLRSRTNPSIQPSPFLPP